MSDARRVANANRQVPKLGPALFHRAGFEQPSLQSAGHPMAAPSVSVSLRLQSALVRFEYELPFDICLLLNYTQYFQLNSIPFREHRGCVCEAR